MCGGGGGSRPSPAPQPTPAPAPPPPAPKPVVKLPDPVKAQDPKTVTDDPNVADNSVDNTRRKKRAGNAANAGISRLKITSGANVGGAGGSGVNVAAPI